MSNRIWVRRRARSRMNRAVRRAIKHPGKAITAFPGITVTVTFGPD